MPKSSSLPLATMFALSLLSACSEEKPRPTPAPPPPPQVNEYRAARAEFGIHFLRGGTQVTLAPESEMRHESPSTGTAQTVNVTGQAHFIITGDSSFTYDITAGRATLRADSAAELMVRAYPADSTVRAVISRGTVTFRFGDSTQTLTAGDIATIAKDGKLSIRHRKDVSQFFTWTNGMVHYDDVPFRDLIPDLERIYDVKIIVKDPQLLRERVSAEFHTGSFSDMLGVLVPIIDATFTVQDRAITLAHDPEPGRPAPPPKHTHEH